MRNKMLMLLIVILSSSLFVSSSSSSSSSSNSSNSSNSNSSQYAVISTPFATSSNTYDMIRLNDNITISIQQQFTMDKSTQGDIVFLHSNNDNTIFGLVSQERGTIGIFKVSNNSEVVVIDKGYKSRHCNSNSIVKDPYDDNRIYVLDVNTDGGICSLSINTNTNDIIDEGLVMKIENPLNMIFPSNLMNNAIVISLNGIATMIDINNKEQLGDSIIIFKTTNRDGSPDALVSSSTITYDNKYILVLDNNIFDGTSRFAVISINSNTLVLSTTQVLSDNINDPSSIISSPFNNDVLIISCQGNGLIRYKYNNDDEVSPYIYQGPITYNGNKPQLPSNLQHVIGNPQGRVYLSELSGLRGVQFYDNGDVVDLGLSVTGDSNDDIVGSYGLLPIL